MKKMGSSMKKLVGAGSTKKMVAVEGGSTSAPVVPQTSAPPAVAPLTVTEEEKQYELEVPPNTMPGSKLKLTIPGMAEKVVITVPEGAVPGATISFSLPKTAPKPAAAPAGGPAPKASEDRAAIMIQARMRGKSTRKNMTKIELKKKAPSAAPAAGAPATPADEPEEYDASEVVALAPGLMQDTGTVAAVTVDDEPSAAAATPPPTPAAGWTLGGMMKRSLGNVLGAFGGQPALPATPPEAAFASELTRIGATAISAWEEADFDAFASVALSSVSVSLPGFTDKSMQGVWAAREEQGTVEGVLSIDTVMAQQDDEDHATLVAIEHTYDTSSSGMITKHSWVRMQFVKQPAAEGEASWKIEELVFDPIWPKSQEEDAAPEEFRLGLGRTLRQCTDVTSLCAVLFTSWLAGDRNRFESVAAPDLAVSIKALDIMAKNATEAYDARTKLLAHGNLIAFNSPMVDSESEPGKVRVLAHAHLYDTADDDAFGQATVHFALGITFSTAAGGADPMVTQIVSDVIWMGEGVTPETEGLSFESSPLQSIYTRSLTYVKAWETNSKEGISSLTTKDVALEVPKYAKNETGQAALLSYRDTLNTLGMMTVDTVRVTPTRFEAVIHEYGIDAGQHGLPLMHGELKLDYENQRDGSVLIKRVFLNVEFIRQNRRSSVLQSVGAQEELAAEL